MLNRRLNINLICYAFTKLKPVHYYRYGPEVYVDDHDRAENIIRDVPALLKTLFRERPIDEAMKILMEVHLHSARSDMSLALNPRFRPQLSVGARQTMYTLADTYNRALPHRNCIMIAIKWPYNDFRDMT